MVLIPLPLKQFLAQGSHGRQELQELNLFIQMEQIVLMPALILDQSQVQLHKFNIIFQVLLQDPLI